MNRLFVTETIPDPVKSFFDSKKVAPVHEATTAPSTEKITLLQHYQTQKALMKKPLCSQKIGVARGDKGDDKVVSESGTEKSSPVMKTVPASQEDSTMVIDIADEKVSKTAATYSPNRTKLSYAPRVFAVGVNAFMYLNNAPTSGGHLHHNSVVVVPKTSVAPKSIKIQLGGGFR